MKKWIGVHFVPVGQSEEALMGGVVLWDEGVTKEVNLKASFDVEKQGKHKGEEPKIGHDFSKYLRAMGFAQSKGTAQSFLIKMCSNKETFFKEYAEDGYVTITVTLEISKKQEELKPAVEKRQENLAKDVGKLLGEEATTNYMVECEGLQFPCHRAVLAARSSTFANGFQSGLVEGVLQRWVVKDADPADVKGMLAFIYTSNIPKAVEQRPVELLDLAMKYDLPDLALACRKAVVAGLTYENAVRSLIELDKFKVTEPDEAKEAVIEFIKKHCREVIKSPDWPQFMKNFGPLVNEIIESACG
jgi:speckle-type POZ protein